MRLRKKKYWRYKSDHLRCERVGGGRPQGLPLQKMKKTDEEKLLGKLDRARLPVHIAIIMDGNGRWAKMKGLSRIGGHRAGVNTVKEIVLFCNDLGIKVLTLYTFSTENWKRPKVEVRALMSILKRYLRKEIEELKKQRIRLKVIGRLSELPSPVRRELENGIKATSENHGLILNLALNYGGRIDILDGVRKLIKDIQKGECTLEDLDEELFSRYLYTSGLPDPDLLIRTAGEMRVSNFLLWQISYAEIWVTPTYWPDFHRANLLQAIVDYQTRERRFGGLN